jgi:hypothetical protein
VESPRIAYLFSRALLQHHFLSHANDIEVESPRVAYLCKSRIVTTPLPLTRVQIQAPRVWSNTNFQSWSKYPYLLFPISLFFLIFEAFIIEFSICDLLRFGLDFVGDFGART